MWGRDQESGKRGASVVVMPADPVLAIGRWTRGRGAPARSLPFPLDDELPFLVHNDHSVSQQQSPSVSFTVSRTGQRAD